MTKCPHVSRREGPDHAAAREGAHENGGEGQGADALAEASPLLKLDGDGAESAFEQQPICMSDGSEKNADDVQKVEQGIVEAEIEGDEKEHGLDEEHSDGSEHVDFDRFLGAELTLVEFRADRPVFGFEFDLGGFALKKDGHEGFFEEENQNRRHGCAPEEGQPGGPSGVDQSEDQSRGEEITDRQPRKLWHTKPPADRSTASISV